jgi:hypothetical protein
MVENAELMEENVSGASRLLTPKSKLLFSDIPDSQSPPPSEPSEPSEPNPCIILLYVLYIDFFFFKKKILFSEKNRR